MKAEPPQARRRPRPSRDGLVVRNLQRRHAVDREHLSSFLAEVASAVGASERSATVALVNDEKIQALNRDFRGYDKPTDVLSFAAGGAYLGDVVISVETAYRQARRRGTTLRRELSVLTLHGFLHLLGYDHERDDGEMRRLEYRLRKRFGIGVRRRSGR
jgi:probable rRNA maturation factor